jgi:hypothetical protein
VIDRLTYLCEQMRAAQKFEELDLGWWEPLLEEVHAEGQWIDESDQS